LARSVTTRGPLIAAPFLKDPWAEMTAASVPVPLPISSTVGDGSCANPGPPQKILGNALGLESLP
jgi:hypothetical protein